MSDKVFAGDYTDIKFIKSRKVAQVFIEIPLERANDFIAAFGTPNPATGVPVALARIMPEATEASVEKPRQWKELSAAQQAGIRCQDTAFITFLNEKHSNFVGDPQSAAEFVRKKCRIKSRSELNTNHEAGIAWKMLDGEFQMWLRHPEMAA